MAAIRAMSLLQTRLLAEAPTEDAPDGSRVSVLLRLDTLSTVHVLLPAGQISRAVAHRSVSEVWYVTQGSGQMWRELNGHEDYLTLKPGVCLSLPVGARFQFRAAPDQALSALCITTPPWPGVDEAMPASGPWVPSVHVHRLKAPRGLSMRACQGCEFQSGHRAVLAPRVPHPDEHHRAAPVLRVAGGALVGLTLVVVVARGALVQEGLTRP